MQKAKSSITMFPLCLSIWFYGVTVRCYLAELFACGSLMLVSDMFVCEAVAGRSCVQRGQLHDLSKYWKLQIEWLESTYCRNWDEGLKPTVSSLCFLPRELFASVGLADTKLKLEASNHKFGRICLVVDQNWKSGVIY
jgi:hypothetical protein